MATHRSPQNPSLLDIQAEQPGARMHVEGTSNQAGTQRSAIEQAADECMSSHVLPQAASQAGPVLELVAPASVAGSLFVPMAAMDPDYTEPTVVTGSVSASPSASHADGRFAFADVPVFQPRHATPPDARPTTVRLSDNTQFIFKDLSDAAH